MTTTWTCTVCGSPFRPATREALTFDWGVEITLMDLEVHRCSKCDEYEYEIPRMEELTADVADFVAKKIGKLAPGEIRFLRKYLGLSGADAAKRLHVSAETMSRWENGVRPMAPTAERLLRLLALKDRPILDYEKFDATGINPPISERLKARMDEDGWAVGAA